jgi:hypothetical protein
MKHLMIVVCLTIMLPAACRYSSALGTLALSVWLFVRLQPIRLPLQHLGPIAIFRGQSLVDSQEGRKLPRTLTTVPSWGSNCC